MVERSAYLIFMVETIGTTAGTTLAIIQSTPSLIAKGLLKYS
jgi:hypothetical protein